MQKLPNPELKQKVRILEKLNNVLSMQKLALFLIEHIYIYIITFPLTSLTLPCKKKRY